MDIKNEVKSDSKNVTINQASSSCNLAFQDPNINLVVSDNVATVTVGYFIENIGSIQVTDVFNTGTLSFPEEFIFDNITTNSSEIIITSSPGQILYEGNIGSLVPNETALITLQFDIIGVRNTGDFLISNISVVTDGQGDEIVYSDNVTLNIVDISFDIKYSKHQFAFQLTNPSQIEYRIDISAIIFIPTDVEVVFRNFTPFTATFLNSDRPVPTNTILSGPNAIRLSTERFLLQPFTTTSIPVQFEVYSSSLVGKQKIIATYDEINLRNGNQDTIFIQELPSKYSTTQATVNLTVS